MLPPKDPDFGFKRGSGCSGEVIGVYTKSTKNCDSLGNCGPKTADETCGSGSDFYNNVESKAHQRCWEFCTTAGGVSGAVCDYDVDVIVKDKICETKDCSVTIVGWPPEEDELDEEKKKLKAGTATAKSPVTTCTYEATCICRDSGSTPKTPKKLPPTKGGDKEGEDGGGKSYPEPVMVGPLPEDTKISNFQGYTVALEDTDNCPQDELEMAAVNAFAASSVEEPKCFNADYGEIEDETGSFASKGDVVLIDKCKAGGKESNMLKEGKCSPKDGKFVEGSSPVYEDVNCLETFKTRYGDKLDTDDFKKEFAEKTGIKFDWDEVVECGKAPTGYGRCQFVEYIEKEVVEEGGSYYIKKINIRDLIRTHIVGGKKPFIPPAEEGKKCNKETIGDTRDIDVFPCLAFPPWCCDREECLPILKWGNSERIAEGKRCEDM